MSYALKCDACGSYIGQPFEDGNECRCGGTYRRAPAPYRHYDTGCSGCDYEAAAMAAGRCERGEAMNGKKCGWSTI